MDTTRDFSLFGSDPELLPKLPAGAFWQRNSTDDGYSTVLVADIAALVAALLPFGASLPVVTGTLATTGKDPTAIPKVVVPIPDGKMALVQVLAMVKRGDNKAGAMIRRSAAWASNGGKIVAASGATPDTMTPKAMKSDISPDLGWDVSSAAAGAQLTAIGQANVSLSWLALISYAIL